MIPTLQVGKPRHTEVIYPKSLRKSENKLTTEPGKITFQRLVKKKKKTKIQTYCILLKQMRISWKEVVLGGTS